MSFLRKLFSQKERKKINENIGGIKGQTILEIKKIENEKFSEKSINEFIFIFRTFIKNHYDIKEQPTKKSIISKLEKKEKKEKIKEKIILILNVINEIEFADKKIDEKEFKKMIILFKELIKEI